MESYVVEKSIFMNGKDAASCFFGVVIGLFFYSRSLPEFFVGTVITMICFLSLSSPSDIVERQLAKYARSTPSFTSMLLNTLSWPLLWCSLVVLISLTRHWGLAVTILYSLYVLLASKEMIKYVTALAISAIFFTANRFVQRAPEWSWFYMILSNVESLFTPDQTCNELQPHIAAVYWSSFLSILFVILLLIDRKSIFTQNIYTSPLSTLLPAPYLATYDFVYFWLKGIRSKSSDSKLFVIDEKELNSIDNNGSSSNNSKYMKDKSKTMMLEKQNDYDEDMNAPSIDDGNGNDKFLVDMKRKESTNSTASVSAATISINRPVTRAHASSSIGSRSHSNSIKSQ